MAALDQPASRMLKAHAASSLEIFADLMSPSLARYLPDKMPCTEGLVSPSERAMLDTDSPCAWRSSASRMAAGATMVSGRGRSERSLPLVFALPAYT